MFKFLHAADLHIDSPLKGLDNYEGAPVDEIRGATRRALENLVNLAIEEKVAFVLFAGDIYDGDWPDFNTGLFFIKQMAILQSEGIKVYMVAGNHDADNKMTKKLRMPENVYMFSSKKSKTVLIDELESAIHGQSFATGSTSENLATGFPASKNNYFNIGLLHTSVDGREGHADYSPCTLNHLINKGYDYWALGHIHKREVLNEEPLIVFSGNTQGRHARETGQKGCTLITVKDGNIEAADHHSLDVLRWDRCEINVSGVENTEEILGLLKGALDKVVMENPECTLAVRIVVMGETKAHYEIHRDTDNFVNECRAQVLSSFGEEIWVEKVKIETSPPAGTDSNLEGQDLIRGILKRIEDISSDDDELDKIIKQLAEFKRKLPPEISQGDEPFDLTDPLAIKEMLKCSGDLICGKFMESDQA
jgi:DNA repair exonuclease SbcCD nuclease subunit